MNERDRQTQDPATPERLRAALERLHVKRIAVPPEVDDVVLRAARDHLEATSPAPLAARADGQREPRRRGVANWLEKFRVGWQVLLAGRHWAALGAVAVAILSVGALGLWLGGHPRLVARTGDLNGDGVVDMLDAFALARELQHGPASHPEPQLDFNGDGVVDERDVHALAARAVSLEPGGHS